jgi:hypothetical protein
MPAIPFVTIPAVPAPDPVTGPLRPFGWADDHRVVAVAVGVAELLRPGSDLARLLRAAPHADLLLATDEPRLRPVPALPPPPPVEIDDLPPLELDVHAAPEPEPAPTGPAVLAGLGLPGVRVHRLDLRPPLAGRAEDDLVAALSELVGFDPEPGVRCLAPEPVDVEGVVVGRAAQRVAQVYGLPLLRFRSRERPTAAVSGV